MKSRGGRGEGGSGRVFQQGLSQPRCRCLVGKNSPGGVKRPRRRPFLRCSESQHVNKAAVSHWVAHACTFQFVWTGIQDSSCLQRRAAVAAASRLPRSAQTSQRIISNLLNAHRISSVNIWKALRFNMEKKKKLISAFPAEK